MNILFVFKASTSDQIVDWLNANRTSTTLTPMVIPVAPPFHKRPVQLLFLWAVL